MATTITYLAVMMLSVFAGAVFVYNLIPSRDEMEAVQQTTDIGDSIGDKPGLLKIFRLPLSMLIPIFGGWGSPSYRARTKENLDRAGMGELVSVEEVVALKFLLAGLFVLLLLVYQLPLVVLVLAALFGFFFADLWIRDRAKSRGAQIVRELPFALDLLALLVQAGLDFTAGVSKTAAKLHPGPLRDELERMLKEFRLGSSRVEALQHLSERARVREMTTLCTALIQASELGTSIGPTLRQQSEMMRTHRFQEAERRGGVASQQMVLPLVIFILPAVFIMILGPALVRYIYGGGM